MTYKEDRSDEGSSVNGRGCVRRVVNHRYQSSVDVFERQNHLFLGTGANVIKLFTAVSYDFS